MDNGIEVIISSDWGGLGTRLYIVNRASGNDSVARIGDGGALQFIPVDDAGVAEPTIVLPFRRDDIILKAFSDAINKRGIRSKNEDQLQGKMDAQSKHLEDLRHLLKLPK